MKKLDAILLTTLALLLGIFLGALIQHSITSSAVINHYIHSEPPKVRLV